MKELVFSIDNIFNSASEKGCLRQYDSTGYYIPAYQRGYKWGSEPDGAVNILLRDLWDAFERQSRKEYYLQYITVKRKPVSLDGTGTNYLEVIDGQQRLTTLSILVSVLTLLSGDTNYSSGKLHYAIRPDFFAQDIYNSARLQAFISQDWQQLTVNDANNKQDIYYLHAAARHLHHELKNKQPEQRQEFARYLAERVKLIVNSVEAHVPSETVFRNLNSHKEPLTETELIKAVIITKVGRAGTFAERKGFKEIMENRLHLGRLWDETTRWANTPQISLFFFNGRADGMRQLLRLVAGCLPQSTYKLDDADPNSANDRALFNFYHQYPNVGELYRTLKDVQAALADWYADDDRYNLLGFCRFAKNSGKNNLAFLKRCLNCPTRSALAQLLTQTRAEILPNPKELNELSYAEKEDHGAIHAVLLALSVFAKAEAAGTEAVPGRSKKQSIRFHFHAFKTNSWSLEHIFPQSPEGKGAQPLKRKQKAAVTAMLGETCDAELTQLLHKPERSDEEKMRYRAALQQTTHLNSLGNMCLLTAPDNASNGCLFFKAKRGNVLRLVQRGSFVPKHTFDVFSKMMPKLAAHSITAWTVSDIEAHMQHIEEHLEYILTH